MPAFCLQRDVNNFGGGLDGDAAEDDGFSSK